jgi:hypothetical protein
MAKNERDLIASDETRPLGFRPTTAPILPASGGAWFGSPTRLLEIDTKFVETHTKYLEARQQQLVAAENLVAARIALELTSTRLANIEAIKHHEFKRGERERQRELAAWQNQQELDTIQHATAIIEATTARLNAETARLEAEAALAEQKKAQPPQPPAPEAQAAPVQPSLSLDDIEDVVMTGLPELSEDSKFAFLRMLRGMLAEKEVETDKDEAR